MALSIEYVCQPKQLKSALESISSAGQLAVDTEANSRHSYPEQFCLLQIATTEKIYIVDPIMLDDLEPLRPVFLDSGIEKVFHTAEYDIRSIHKHLGFEIRNAYDVSIAARFIGMSKFGLVNILKELLDIDVKKNRKIQESDWAIRPLSKQALEYAADDVRHLLELKTSLDNKLREMGRYDWVREECRQLEDIRYEPVDTETAYLRVKNAKKLNPKELAILKNLYGYREQEALRRSRPPKYLLPDSILTYIAANPEVELSDVPDLNEKRLAQYESGIRDALAKGFNAEPVILDEKRKVTVPFDADSRERFKLLRDWRDTAAGALSLDPSLIWPKTSLKRLAEDPNSFQQELTADELKQWQRDRLSEELSGFLKTIR